MLELTTDNALVYLREKGWIDAGQAEVVCLSGGVSNQVLRVTTSTGRFVLKQSRPQLRTRDAWFSDLERIYREQEVMQALHAHVPDVVPEVLHVDRANYAYAMSHAPIDATVWKTELLAGNIDSELGAKVGQVLGRMHQVSAERASEFAAFRDHTVYVQLRVDPFYVRVQERCPDVAAAIELIVHDMLAIRQALCHGDYTPKNMLIDSLRDDEKPRGEVLRTPGIPGVRSTSPLGFRGFTLVDYETAHVGDPTMDLGLFLAHLTLKAIRSPAHAQALIATMHAFWSGYARETRWHPVDELERRGVRHLGVCLLARVDGTSPVDYLSEEQRQIVRRLGRAILLDGMNRWEEVHSFIAALPLRPRAPG